MTRGARLVSAMVLVGGACVAFDPEQPAAPPLAGRYSAIISIHYHNHLESRFDSLAATVTLPDAARNRLFAGSWVTAQGDSGVIGGTLLWDGTMQVTDFGQPPLVTLQGVTFLHRLYPWCDFIYSIGTGPLEGRVFDDSLVVTGRISMACSYQAWERATDIGTDVDVRLAGAR